jgi:hypothetical protein
VKHAQAKIVEVPTPLAPGRVIAAFQPQVWADNSAHDDGGVRYFDVTEVVTAEGRVATLALANRIETAPWVYCRDRDYVDNLVLDYAEGLLPLAEPHTGYVDPHAIAAQIVAFWQ